VIIDLVVNHTSDQHPWFQSARSSPDSPYRDWYVWSGTAPPDRHQGMVFPGEQAETWTYDRTAKLWYYHRFYKFQPDLDIKPTPRSARRSRRSARSGCSSASPGSGWTRCRSSSRRPSRATRTRPRTWSSSPSCASTCSGAQGDAVLLAEANVEPDQLGVLRRRGRLGQPDPHALRLHAQRPADAGARPAEPGADHRRAARHAASCRPAGSGPRSCATTTRSTCPGSPPSSAPRCSPQFGPDEDMQLYGRGIRRRLAPMLGGDRRRSSWRTRCSSACAAPRCCGTARRSGWATTSRWTAAMRSVRRCSGPCRPTAASRPRRPTGSCARSSRTASSATPRSTSPCSGTTRARCCPGSSG
jgi:maltose alpha-D-glucosyltransferase/alpha-amylase